MVDAADRYNLTPSPNSTVGAFLHSAQGGGPGGTRLRRMETDRTVEEGAHNVGWLLPGCSSDSEAGSRRCNAGQGHRPPLGGPSAPIGGQEPPAGFDDNQRHQCGHSRSVQHRPGSASWKNRPPAQRPIIAPLQRRQAPPSRRNCPAPKCGAGVNLQIVQKQKG